MKKEVIAQVLYYTGISWMCFFLSRLYYGDHIRAVNYHSTPASLSGNFRKQLRWYKKWYSDTRLSDLRSFLQTGTWEKGKPGLILSFDDGKRNNFDIARPLIEAYGFTGWFFIPSGWVVAPVPEQRMLQEQDGPLLEAYPGERVIVDKEELVALSRDHVVGCHTYTHHRMQKNDTRDILQKEIGDANALLTQLCETDNKIFCWVGGEERHYTRQAADLIRESGYQFSFTTNTFPIQRDNDALKLERTNIEADNSIPLLVFQLSGLMDLFYYPKRKRLRSVFG